MGPAIRRGFRQLAVDISDADRAARGADLGVALRMLDDVDARHKALKASMRKERAVALEDVAMLRRAVAATSVVESVACDVYDVGDGFVDVIRTDTGAVVERRAVNEGDRRAMEPRQPRLVSDRKADAGGDDVGSL